MFFGRDPDEMMFEFGLCTFCLGRGCPMCDGTGEHSDHDRTEEKEKEELNIEYRITTPGHYRFFINGEEYGTVEKSIDIYGQNNWKAIDGLDGLVQEGTTKKEAIENLYNRMKEDK